MKTGTGLYGYLAANNLKSLLLLAGYPLLLIGLLWAFGVAFTPGGDPVNAGNAFVAQYWPAALIVTAVWFVIAWLFHQGMINAATGARPLERAENPRVYNMVENLCISRGMKTPRIYVIDSPVLNAYATGLSEGNASVTLTRGIIDALEDDELEAVIGHELSHIRHGDIRLLVVGVIFAGMISFFAEMAGRMLMYGRVPRGDRRGGGAGVLIAFAALMVGQLLALVIRMAVSRKREYLADAGAVELTKNPEAMIRALMKISGRADMPQVPGEVRQMFIENHEAGFLGMFATHPPIEERIRTLAEVNGVDLGALGSGEAHEARKTAGPWG